MVRVTIGQYRPQDAHYGFYRDDLPSGDVIIIRRKVGEPTDYLHPNSRKVRLQRLNFGLASTHYSHLTPIQKKKLRYVGEIVPFSRGRSKSDTKFLQGRTLFISKDIHALNETQRQIPTPLQICIVLTYPDLTPFEGDLWLYYLEDGEWKETTRRLLSPAYWLFPEVPSGKQLYHPVGANYDYYDPQDPETTYLTQKELMLYHYHILLPRPTIASEILRPNAPGLYCGITGQHGEPCPNHWMNVDEEVHDGDETCIYEPTRTWRYDLYTIQQPTAGVYDPKKVTIRAIVKRVGGYAYATVAQPAIRTHDQLFRYSMSYSLWDNWMLLSWELEKNPATKDYWTLEEIADLQIGIRLRRYEGVGWASVGYCTQLYAEVEYYAPL